jgi:uncharacterized membrane protein
MTAADNRIASLDITRGLIVAIMALDHVRIFFSSAQFDPIDLTQTTPAWFFMRLVTHLCAPGFFFIAGFGAALSEQNGLSKRALAGFLLTRGIWLIALELTLMGVAWSFGLNGWFWFGVLWGLGAAMIVLAALIFMPRLALLLAALAAVATQEYWRAVIPAEQGSIWALFASGGVWAAPALGPKLVLYPLLPWLSLMAIGYAVAPMLLRDAKPRGALIMATGIVLLILFIAARVLGIGGGVAPDDPQQVLAFLNVEKYPPSLQFSLLTLGALLTFFGVVATLEAHGRPMRMIHPLRAYGRVPFFFYILHIYLIHGAALLCATVLGWPRDYLFWEGTSWPQLTPPDGYGFGVAGIYLMWVAVLVVLYALCLWFAGVKQRHTWWWLRYL